MNATLKTLAACLAVSFLTTAAIAQDAPTAPAPEILTPAAPATPRINGARVYGERPGRPFIFTIPATGDDPITYSADGLPDGLTLDASTGRISGAVQTAGDYKVTLTATNAQGKDTKPLLIKIGDQLALTPPMGWNSWNCFGGTVTADEVLAAAKTMHDTGLIKHGWTYVNMDDSWQGERGGKYNAIQGNEKFPDMKGLCDQIHALGLKAGIYSTPWAQSYAGYCGGSSNNEDGSWTKATGAKQVNKKIYPWAIGKYHFMKQDAQQWADWGFDYLKYDWNPIETPDVQEMADALKDSGRDFIFSLSNSAPFAGAADWAKYSNAWRISGDITDNWRSMTNNGFHSLELHNWIPFAGPGHWNDPDMLEVGMVGKGARQHPTNLTPDEQYTHISLWCLEAAPLLIGCDMTKMDDFTKSLLTNDEVLAVDQDALGQQATQASHDGGTEVWSRPLADGTIAVGLFNRGRFVLQPPGRNQTTWRLIDRSNTDAEPQEFDNAEDARAAFAKAESTQPVEVTVNWSDLKLTGPQPVRDLWRQKDLGTSDGKFSTDVPFHGVVFVKIGTPTAQ